MMRSKALVYHTEEDKIYRIAETPPEMRSRSQTAQYVTFVHDVDKSPDNWLEAATEALILLSQLIPLARSLWAAIKRAWISAFGSDEQKRALQAWKRAGKPR